MRQRAPPLPQSQRVDLDRIQRARPGKEHEAATWRSLGGIGVGAPVNSGEERSNWIPVVMVSRLPRCVLSLDIGRMDAR
jgi:hypothetical protein